MSSLKERKKVEDQQETITQLKSDATKHEVASTELKSTVAQQQKAMDVLAADLKEQAAQIQKVSAQLAAASPSRGGPAPQTVCLSAITLREGANNP